MNGLPMYKLQAIPASAAALAGAAGQHRLMGFVLFGGSADSQVEFKDAATDTGTVLIGANALAKTTVVVDLGCYGGVLFSTGIFCKPAGTGAICYVWYE